MSSLRQGYAVQPLLGSRGSETLPFARVSSAHETLRCVVAQALTSGDGCIARLVRYLWDVLQSGVFFVSPTLSRTFATCVSSDDDGA